ncbi:hypothetical protein [Caldicellulosiruptor naganoensis]|uniref:Stage II sporulation protein E N-terminal domain-containing protein n=1 Tax=Caldicellulosiruptor naganoensis TaxID=29324 RepID=A0ABY7BJ68_9FIRM|nr:hypothetical protein [Caldicellulosiruptor naganoensis]WAM32639.1 hypothetical protein OTJ99_000061 [Caldicellulosiruptor naganoensis]
MFVGGILSIAVFKWVPIEILYLLLESLFCYSFVLLFERFFAALESKKQISNDQIAISVVVFALSFLGLSNTFDTILDIKRILFLILLFTISFAHGMIMSTAMGYVVGLLDSIKNTCGLEMACIFAFAALVAGVMKGFGKIGVVLGGFCGYVISMFYISSNPGFKLGEILIASILFCIFPLEKVVKNSQTDKEEVQKMIKEKSLTLLQYLKTLGKALHKK